MKIHVKPVGEYSEGIDLAGHEIDLTRAIATTSKRNVADIGAYSTQLINSWQDVTQLLGFEANRQGARISVGQAGTPGTGFVGLYVGRRKSVDNFKQTGVLSGGGYIIAVGGYMPMANNEELWAWKIGTPDAGSYVSIIQERWRDVNAID